MTTIAAARNPIHPYRWIAHYRGGGRLAQFDVDRQHHSTEIEAVRLEAIELRGHSAGPVWLRVLAGARPVSASVRAHTVVLTHGLSLLAFGAGLSPDDRDTMAVDVERLIAAHVAAGWDYDLVLEAVDRMITPEGLHRVSRDVIAAYVADGWEYRLVIDAASRVRTEISTV